MNIAVDIKRPANQTGPIDVLENTSSVQDRPIGEIYTSASSLKQITGFNVVVFTDIFVPVVSDMLIEGIIFNLISNCLLTHCYCLCCI